MQTLKDIAKTLGETQIHAAANFHGLIYAYPKQFRMPSAVIAPMKVPLSAILPTCKPLSLSKTNMPDLELSEIFQCAQNMN